MYPYAGRTYIQLEAKKRKKKVKAKPKKIAKKRKLAKDKIMPQNQKQRKIKHEELVPKIDAPQSVGGKNYKKMNFKSKLSSSVKVRCWKCGETLRKAQWLVLHNTIHYLEFLQEKENNQNLK